MTKRNSESVPSVDSVLALIRGRRQRGMTVSQLVNHFAAERRVGRSEARRVLRPLLRQLERDTRIVVGRGKRYFAVEATEMVTGRMRVRGGIGMLMPDDAAAEPVPVPSQGMRGTLDGDRVLVRLQRPRRRARGETLREGFVVRVLERRHSVVVGRWVTGRGRPHVRPVDRRLGISIVPADSSLTAELAEGDLVAVSLASAAPRATRVRGTLVERIGRLGEPGVDERAVLWMHGIEEELPPAAIAEAEALSDTMTNREIARRWDLRDRPAITIDPETARDFDDAVSASRKGENIDVEVHIADVGHHVRAGSALDAAAQERGTSVYLPGRCVPMLPERLSGDLCSLREGVDRLTWTVRFTVGPGGKVTRWDAGESVIRSRRRCTYGEVFEWLESPRAVWPATCDPFAESLEHLATAASRLQKARTARGSLDFDLAEPDVMLDADGRVLAVRPRVRTAAHRLVEELMVAANGCVARMLMARAQPTLHRVHARPDPARVEELRPFLAQWGHRIDGDAHDLPPASLQRVLAAVSGRPEERAVSMAVLRSMARAVYTPEPQGHYALATDAYLHFTSPIRRYPDLVCHRMLRRLQQEGGPVDEAERQRLLAELQVLGAKCSAAEERAEEAERLAVHWKTVLYLQGRTGEIFDGFISGVVSFGLFVHLDEVLIDGMVHISELGDREVVLDGPRRQLLERGSRRRWRLGDRVKARLVRVDLDAMQVGLELV